MFKQIIAWFKKCWRNFLFWKQKCNYPNCNCRAKYLVNYTLRNLDGIGITYYQDRNLNSQAVDLCEKHKNNLLNEDYEWPTLVGFWVRKKIKFIQIFL